jgi:hypothetical protein
MELCWTYRPDSSSFVCKNEEHHSMHAKLDSVIYGVKQCVGEISKDAL